MIEWPDGVNTKILRESEWDVPSGMIREKTRSGKDETRPGKQLKPNQYDIEMHFNKNEYLIFHAWYESTLRKGALSFSFPDIITKLVDREYRIPEGYHGKNVSGDIIVVTMLWEEVK